MRSGSRGWCLGLASTLFLLPSAAGAAVDFGIRGGAYTDVGEGFVGAELLFPVSRAIFFNPNFEYVFVQDGDLATFNADFHYDFWSEGSVTVWAGAGAALINSDLPRDRRDDDETDFGLNLLAGIGALRGSLRPYLQGKAILADDNEFVVAVGLRFY
jgi:hypothetical protein